MKFTQWHKDFRSFFSYDVILGKNVPTCICVVSTFEVALEPGSLESRHLFTVVSGLTSCPTRSETKVFLTTQIKEL